MVAVCGTSTLTAADQIYEEQSATKEFTTPTTWEGTESEKVSYSSNKKDNISYPYAGAMELNPSTKPFILEIKGYGDVSFDYNVMSGANVYGGAIHFVSSYYAPSTATLTLTGNKEVSFVGNQSGADANAGPVAGTSPNVYGGAMYVNNYGSANIVNNGLVLITDNSALGVNNAYGGAIYVTGTAPADAVSLNISGNTDGVRFERNRAEAEKDRAYGGAININSSSSTLALNNNKKELLFSENIATNGGKIVQGGAIATSGKTSISGNEKVTFTKNGATSTYTSENASDLGQFKAWGGAILASNADFTICDNGAVTFEGNYVQNDNIPSTSTMASTKLPSIAGGAIYAQNGIQMQNNGDVLFAGNCEKYSDGYRLRAIYVQNGDAVFSASADKKIEFQDGITVSKNNMELNASYGEKAQTGTIIMTGANTKTLLETLKGEGNVSDTEIANSQRFEVKGTTTLHGGTLKVEDSANFVGGGFATADAANATVELKEATFDHGTNEVAITSGSSLVVNNSATLNAGTLTMAAGSTLTFNALVDTTTAEQGVLGGTIGSASIGGTVNVALSFDSDYLQSISEETALTIKLVGATTLTWNENDAPGSLTYEGLDSLVWNTKALELEVKDNALYVTGSLERKKTVEVENGGEIGSDIAGDTKVTVGGDVTISGNNSHEGGTVIGDADGTDNTANVTLGSNNALGNGGVTVEDGVDATIGTDDGVTAVLPSTGIENNGKLTLNGSYDASNLDTTAGEGDTYVCVDGKEGNNGFLRDGDTVITVVENKGDGLLIVGNDTVVTKDGDELHLSDTGKAGKLDYSEYQIVDDDHAPSVGAIQDMRPDSEAGNELTIAMSGGSLTVKNGETLAQNTKVEATGGTIKTEGNVTIGGNQYEITGTTSISVADGAEVTLKGTNDHTGETLVDNGSKLTVEDAAALGNSSVKLDRHGKLDLNDKAVKNYIDVKGCELHNASAYDGNIDVSGDLTICGSDATANKVTMFGTGTLNQSASEKVTLNAIEMASGASGQLHVDLVVRDGGSIILNDGNMLDVDGSLTLGNGTVFVLNGDEYGKDSVLAEATTYSGATTGTASLSYGYGTYALVNGQIVLTNVFNQRYADLFTAGNWGHATASRAFVNAVRGQRTNTGCIANGRGTAWAALLGGYHDIAGSDIDLKGAAMGVDVKLGEKSSVGVALGYVENDTKPTGWSTLDQTGTYIALYGEHGLKKLSSTSCLSLDWVVAYGQGESEIDSTSWEQDSLQLNSRLSWNKKLSDKLCMSVFGGLEYYTNESDTVGGMKTGSIQNLRGELGVGASYVVWGVPGSETVTDEKGAEIATTGTGCRRLVVHGELRYMNDMVRSNPVIRMDGLSGTGENPGRSGIGIEAGATYRFNDRWSASANYGFNALDDSREHRVNVGASYTF